MRFLAFLVTSGAFAVEVAFYVKHHNPWNLGSAVFCGLLTVYILLTMEGRDA